MITHFRVKTNCPTQRLNRHVSPVSPLPKLYTDAFNDLNPNWQNVMCDEYNALIKNKTWTLVPRPTDTNIVRYMWLFRHKYLADGTLTRYKARLVANDRGKLQLIVIMSSENGVHPPAPNPSHNSNFSLLSVLGRERLTGPNYMDWKRNLRFTLRYENKKYVLNEKIPTINDDSTQEEIEAHQKHYDDANKGKASKERLDVVKSLMACKPKPRASICAFVLEMKGYFDMMESLNMVFDAELSINIILSGLQADYNQFMLSYQMNRKETSIMELHSLLQTAEKGPQGKSDRGSKRKAESEIATTSDLKEAVCFYCNIKGH
ncbi:RNA-directed DNA polymerase, eukaryota [Tanacetum coccineum]|uniref:RNA-directed DNA polymerase, eukaryota n=1 Tax=Tanacetum coccineum TaxID=301880 RepID=A0ABQ5H5A8_9ASTR